MAKFRVQYVRIEHHLYQLDIDADNATQAEDIARETFDGSEPRQCVHGEEYVHDVELLSDDEENIDIDLDGGLSAINEG